MIECLLAWIMLFLGILEHNPILFVASGVYAIASRIYSATRKEYDE